MDGSQRLLNVLQRWSEKIAQVLESMTGSAATCEWSDAQPSDGQTESIAWEQPLSLAPDAITWLVAPGSTWNAIGSQTLAAAGITDAEPSDIRSTYVEIVSQWYSALAQILSQEFGREVTAASGREGSEPVGASQRRVLVIRAGEDLPCTVVFNDAFLGAFVTEVPRTAAPSRGQDEAEEPIEESNVPDYVQGSKTLEVLLEVELPVSVSFGRAQLALKDVLKLTTGSIVELNRAVSEPVEVVVNNCVVARGEVVVVEGNYGVRVQHLISQQERLRTLT